MASPISEPELAGRSKPPFVLLFLIAVAVGLGISRIQWAISTTDTAVDTSPDVSGQKYDSASSVKSKSETASTSGESASVDPLTITSVLGDKSSIRLEDSALASGDLVEERTSAVAAVVPDGAAVAASDAELKAQMPGTWEDDYKGHRTLTLNEDGSGTMVVELDGFAATIFAKKLTFQEEWSVENGRVTMTATGGEPAVKVRLVLSIHGDSSTQRIVEVTDDRMILVEEPSGTRFEWMRVEETIQQER